MEQHRRRIHEDRPYLVMQAIDGIPLEDLIPEHDPLPVGWVAAIGAQICSVLTAAHRAGLLHRDLKPANVMVAPDGWVTVLDFGLALDLYDDRPRVTSTGDPVPGTPGYIAPEQLTRGVSSVASDLYSVGCTLYEMLAGRPPFDERTSFSVMSAHAGLDPMPLAEIRDDVPRAIADVVRDLLSKDPAGRPAGADAVMRVLLPYADGSVPLPGAIDPAAAGAPRHGYARAVTAVFTRPAAPATARAPGREPAPPVDAAAARAARLQLADDLFARGEFEPARAAYETLAADLSGAGAGAGAGPDAGLGFDCAVKAATCEAMVGRSRAALSRSLTLLEDYRSVFGPNDERILELRHQVALLKWTCGEHDAARLALTDLLDHLQRLRGPDDVLTRRVSADVDRHARRA